MSIIRKIFIPFIILSAGCSQRPADGPAVNIDINTNALTDDAGVFFESYRYTMLQTDSTSVIGNIDNIDIDRDSDYIVINSRNDIFVYNRTGRIISCFNNFGQGPQEYLNISDLKVYDGSIYILSRASKEIKIYDLKGKYINCFRLPDYYTDIEITDGAIWLASTTSNDTGYEFAMINLKSGEIERMVMPFDDNKNFINTAFNPFLMSHSNRLYVARQFDMTVQTIDCTDGTVTPEWNFHVDTEKQLSDYGDDLSYHELYQATANKPVVTNPGLMAKTASATYMTINIFFKIGYFTNIYKFDDTGQQVPGKLLRIGLTSYEGYPFLKSKPLLYHNRNYVSALDAAQVLAIAYNEGIDDFRENGLTEDSNPVIFFHKLK